MKTGKLALLFAAVAYGVLSNGCGGGGSDAPSPAPAPAPAPADGDYAGTYSCNNMTGHDGVFTAVLPTATGNFSSCSGSVDAGADPFACTGSISSTGSFLVDTIDNSGIKSNYTGTVIGATVTGTFVVPTLDISGTFSCTR